MHVMVGTILGAIYAYIVRPQYSQFLTLTALD